jgi:hypothetical protein
MGPPLSFPKPGHCCSTQQERLRGLETERVSIKPDGRRGTLGKGRDAHDTDRHGGKRRSCPIRSGGEPRSSQRQHHGRHTQCAVARRITPRGLAVLF